MTKHKQPAAAPADVTPVNYHEEIDVRLASIQAFLCLAYHAPGFLQEDGTKKAENLVAQARGLLAQSKEKSNE